MTPQELQQAIQASPGATSRVLSWLDARGIEHSGLISGATLAAVLGVDSRTWRRWVGGEREFPAMAERLALRGERLDKMRKPPRRSPGDERGVMLTVHDCIETMVRLLTTEQRDAIVACYLRDPAIDGGRYPRHEYWPGDPCPIVDCIAPHSGVWLSGPGSSSDEAFRVMLTDVGNALACELLLGGLQRPSDNDERQK